MSIALQDSRRQTRGRGTILAGKPEQSAFTYGADGLRRHARVTNQTDQTVTTTSSMLDGSSVVRETVTRTGQAAETVTYLVGANGPAYRRSGAGVKTWYAYDGLGSVLGEISAATGNLAKARVYDAYGTVRAEDTATSQSKHRFVGALGHPSEGETGLIYMRARYMDASTGRFISEDPAKDGGNWFVYCGNNPINMSDRSGQEASLADYMLALGATLIRMSWFLIGNAVQDVMSAWSTYTEICYKDPASIKVWQVAYAEFQTFQATTIGMTGGFALVAGISLMSYGGYLSTMEEFTGDDVKSGIDFIIKTMEPLSTP